MIPIKKYGEHSLRMIQTEGEREGAKFPRKSCYHKLSPAALRGWPNRAMSHVTSTAHLKPKLAFVPSDWSEGRPTRMYVASYHAISELKVKTTCFC